MFGKGSGWGISTAAHTLDITLGGVGEKAVREDGQIEFREYLCMTIRIDHDVIDVAPVRRFALRLKELIESGYGLIDQVTSARRSNSMLQAWLLPAIALSILWLLARLRLIILLWWLVILLWLII